MSACSSLRSLRTITRVVVRSSSELSLFFAILSDKAKQDKKERKREGFASGDFTFIVTALLSPPLQSIHSLLLLLSLLISHPLFQSPRTSDSIVVVDRPGALRRTSGDRLRILFTRWENPSLRKWPSERGSQPTP